MAFFLKSGKFVTKNLEGFYTIGHPTVSPEIEPEGGTVSLTSYDKIVGATNTVQYYSSVVFNTGTHTLECQ